MAACVPAVPVEGEVRVEVDSPIPGGAWLRVNGVRSEALAQFDGRRGRLEDHHGRWTMSFEVDEEALDGVLQVRDEAPRRVIASWVDGHLVGETRPGNRLPTERRAWSAYDVGDVIVVRPTSETLGAGLADAQLDEMLADVLGGRGPYDFALVVESAGLPSRLRSGGLAGFQALQQGGVSGVGPRPAGAGDGVVRGVIWMNAVEVWDPDDPLTDWVFCQELGHWRLAWARVDLGIGPEPILTGRGGSHWSYFLHTGASPMEGNTWHDHGDGTFTSVPEAGLGPFSGLDRYLLGLVAPEAVAPFFLIVPDAREEARSTWPPEARHGDPPRTVRGTRLDLTVNDVMRAEGQARPGPDEVDRELEIATVLVVGPDELVPMRTVQGASVLQEQWSEAWATCTGGGSSADFTLLEPGRVWGP